jgi:hypothetical protein
MEAFRHSTDGGTSFTKLSNISLADGIGFGMAASGATYPSIYLAGQVGSVRGFYASTDGGNTWTQINDSAHQWYYSGFVIHRRSQPLRPRLHCDQWPRHHLRRWHTVAAVATAALRAGTSPAASRFRRRHP